MPVPCHLAVPPSPFFGSTSMGLSVHVGSKIADDSIRAEGGYRSLFFSEVRSPKFTHRLGSAHHDW